jgi:hypothetical protein
MSPGFLESANMDGAFGHIIGLTNALAWPLVTGGLVFMLRDPLSHFLGGIAGRIKSFSAFQLSVELVTVPRPPNPWSNIELPAGADLAGGAVTSTTIMELFKRIRRNEPWRYLVADVKDGKFWLLSRLYVFTAILQHLRAVQCVVFVETSDGSRQRFLGIALADDVLRTLAALHPWLDDVFSHSWLAKGSYRKPLDIESAEGIVNSFINDPRIQSSSAPSNPNEWESLRPGQLWEHTRWMTRSIVNTVFDGVLVRHDEVAVVRTPDKLEASPACEIRKHVRLPEHRLLFPKSL